MNNEENKTNKQPDQSAKAQNGSAKPAPPPMKTPAAEAKDGKKKPKFLYILIPVIAVLVIGAIVFAVVMTAGKKANSGPVPLTDENGVTVKDENGNVIMVQPELIVTEYTDENGVVHTTQVYKEVTVTVPVTDANGEFVTDKNGEVVTETKIVTPTAAPETTGGKGGKGDKKETEEAGDDVIETKIVPITDGQGNTGVDPSGNILTTIVEITSNPAIIEEAKIDWKATQGGSKNDYFSAAALTSDKCYVTANITNSKDGDFKDLDNSAFATPYTVLTKYNADGKIVWQKAVGTKGILAITALAATNDGGFYAAGYGRRLADDVEKGYYDGCVFKFDKDGKEEWHKTFGTSTVDLFNGAAVSSDGGVIVVGSVGNNDFDAAGFGGKELNSRAVAVKYSPKGDLVWKNVVGGNQDTFEGVVETDDGVFCVGNFYSGELFKNFGKSDGGVVKFDKNGKFVKASAIGGTGIENFEGIVAAADGGITVCGRSNSQDIINSDSFFTGELSSRGGYDAYIIKYDKDLNVIFKKPFRGQNDDSLTSIIAKDDGSFVAAGYTNSSSRDLKGITTRGKNDIVVVCFDNHGEIIWERAFGGTSEDSAAGLCFGADNGYFVVGKTTSKDVDLDGISPYTGTGTSVGVMVKFPD